MGRLPKSFLAVLVAGSILAFSVAPAAADGIIIPQPPVDEQVTWRDVPLRVRYHQVDVTIDDQVVTTHVDQVFVNDATYQVEGTYIFPLPADATVSSFDMWVDGAKMEGKVLSSEEARRIYEDIVRRQRDPALLEYVGRGAVQVHIFPIPAGVERRVELTYSQVLTSEEGLVHYRYPLNTEKFSSRPLERVAVTVTIHSSSPIRALYSPSHTVDIERDGANRAVLSYEESGVRPDRDFDLYFSTSTDDVAANLVTYKGAGEDGFFLLLVTPEVQTGDSKPIAKDVILVLDTSGSMDGEKMLQAQDAAYYVLDHLGAEDRFDIVSFSSATRLFSPRLQPASRADDGRDYVAALTARGSTDINRALLEAIASAESERPTVVIFVTDGLPTIGVTDPDEIVARITSEAPKSIRLFTFGVGYDVDTVLLDQLSSTLRGTSGYVRPEQKIDEEVSALYSKVSAPVLLDVEMQWTGALVEDVQPTTLPDLFAGTQLVIAGRYREGGEATLRISGTVDGRPVEFEYNDLQFADRGGNELIPGIWAQRKIGELLAQVRLSGPEQELIDEIVELSTRFGIVTPYTSFLVEEPELALSDAGRQTLGESLAEPAPASGGGTSLVPSVRSGEAAVDRAAQEKSLVESEQASGSTHAEIRQVGNKAFVQQGDEWVDTSFDATAMKASELPFGGRAYFDLLTAHPEAGQYLALGDRVTFVLDDLAYTVVAASSEPETTLAPTAEPAATALATAPAEQLATPAPISTVASSQLPTPEPAGQTSAPPICPGSAALGLVGVCAPLLALRKRARH